MITKLTRLLFICMLIACSGGIPDCDDLSHTELLKAFSSEEYSTFSRDFNKKNGLELTKTALQLRDTKLDSIKEVMDAMMITQITYRSDRAELLYHSCTCDAEFESKNTRGSFRFELRQSDDDYNPKIHRVWKIRN